MLYGFSIASCWRRPPRGLCGRLPRDGVGDEFDSLVSLSGAFSVAVTHAQQMFTVLLYQYRGPFCTGLRRKRVFMPASLSVFS